MRLIIVAGPLIVALAAPAWAMSDAELLRKAAQATRTTQAVPSAGQATPRDHQGRREGSLEPLSADTKVIRDNQGNRVGTMERYGGGWLVRDRQGRRIGSVEGR